MHLYHGSADDDDNDFGPGAALVLSLFAVLLVVGALGWSDAQRGRGSLPQRFIAIAESEAGHSQFTSGQADLTREARRRIAVALGDNLARLRARTSADQSASNHLQVIGYASPEGSGNERLAASRASNVRDYLVNDLGLPPECVVVASYADSHSPALKRWLLAGHSLAEFRRQTPAEQRQMLGLSETELGRERRVEILGVHHRDSTCRLDRVTLRR